MSFSKSKLVVACTTLSAIATLCCSQAQAVLVTASSTLPTDGLGNHVVAPNTPFVVTLSLSGWLISDGQTDGISFDVNFDNTLLDFTSGSILSAGAFINDNQAGSAPTGPAIAASPNAGGSVGGTTNVPTGVWGFSVSDGNLNDQGAGPAGSGALGSVTFTSGSTLGTATISPTNAVFIETFDNVTTFGLPFVPGSGVAFTPINVTVVPEPSPFLLLGAVATAFGFCHWRRKRSVSPIAKE